MTRLLHFMDEAETFTWRYDRTRGLHQPAEDAMTQPEPAELQGPKCDCPHDDDLGVILHREGCARGEWLNDVGRRMFRGA